MKFSPRFADTAPDSATLPDRSPMPVNRTHPRSRKPPLTFLLLLLLFPTPSHAHILQTLTWFKIARTIEVSPGEIRVTHDCHFDPTQFRPADPLMDTDGDSTASTSEIAAFCLVASNYLAQDFAVVASNAPCPTRQTSFFVFDDNSGFRSEIIATVAMPPGTTQTLEILDPSYIFPSPPSPGAADTPAIAVAATPQITLLDGKNTPQRQIPTPHDVRTSLHVVLTKSDHATTAPK